MFGVFTFLEYIEKKHFSAYVAIKMKSRQMICKWNKENGNKITVIIRLYIMPSVLLSK